MVKITVLGIYTKYFRRYTKFNINYSLEDCAVNWIAIIILAISDLALLKKYTCSDLLEHRYNFFKVVRQLFFPYPA